MLLVLYFSLNHFIRFHLSILQFFYLFFRFNNYRLWHFYSLYHLFFRHNTRLFNFLLLNINNWRPALNYLYYIWVMSYFLRLRHTYLRHYYLSRNRLNHRLMNHLILMCTRFIHLACHFNSNEIHFWTNNTPQNRISFCPSLQIIYSKLNLWLLFLLFIILCQCSFLLIFHDCILVLIWLFFI